MEGPAMDGDWQADLERWLAPFVAALRHKTRARMCPAYVAGLNAQKSATSSYSAFSPFLVRTLVVNPPHVWHR